MVKTEEQKKIEREIFNYWNSKKIVVHRVLNSDISLELGKAIRDYGVEYIKELIDLYAIILEPEFTRNEKDVGEGKYFWSYRWNLFEFLTRGLKKFDGQQASNYLRKQTVNQSKSVVIKREK